MLVGVLLFWGDFLFMVVFVWGFFFGGWVVVVWFCCSVFFGVWLGFFFFLGGCIIFINLINAAVYLIIISTTVICKHLRSDMILKIKLTKLIIFCPS